MAAHQKGKLSIASKPAFRKEIGDLEIRQATNEDIRAVCLLCGELYEEMAILRPDCYTAGRVDEKLFERSVEDRTQELLVATDHGAIIGFVRIAERMTPSYSPNIPKKYAQIADLAVDPAFRGIDIGTALICEAKRWAKGRSLPYLDYSVLSGSGGALRLLQRESFEPVAVTMRCLI